MANSTIMTVRELIKLAFGDKDKNKVNFKHVETILYLMARQLSVLQRHVEVGIDPQLISSLTRKPSILSVTEVKIHATVPEVLERELMNQTSPIHPMTSGRTQHIDEPAVKQNHNISPAPATSPLLDESSGSDEEATAGSKGQRVSYGGVRSKKISPTDSDSDKDKKPFSIEFKKPTPKVQQEKYLVVHRRESEDTGIPEDKYKRVTVVTKEQYLELLNEIKELNEASNKEANKIPESQSLMKELHKSASITHPMSALVLSDRLEQSEKKLGQMVSALETLMKQLNVPKLENLPYPASTIQSAPNHKSSHDKNMTVSHASQVRRTPKKSSYSSKQTSSSWKKERYSSADFWSDSLQSIQIALTQSCRAYIRKGGQEGETQITHQQETDSENDSSLPDIILEALNSSDDENVGIRQTRYSEDTDTSIDQATKPVNGRESCMQMYKGILVCDHEKCTSHCEGLGYSNKGPDDNSIHPCRMTDLLERTNSSQHDSQGKILPETPIIDQKQKGTRKISRSKRVSVESTSDLVYDKPGKLENDKNIKFSFMPRVFNKLGKLTPCVNDKDGKQISPSEIDNYDHIYDKTGHEIPCMYDKDGIRIPWSKIDDSIEVYDKDGNLLPRNYNRVSPKSISKESLYDKNGKQVQWADADEYETLYDKAGRIIPRIFDEDGKPVPWSRVSDFIKTRDKYGNMMSRLFDQNGMLIPWWDLSKYDKVYDKSGDVIPRFSIKYKEPMSWSKIHLDEDEASDYDGKSQYQSQAKGKKELKKGKHIPKLPGATEVITLYDKNGKPVKEITQEDAENVYNQNNQRDPRVAKSGMENIAHDKKSKHISNRPKNYGQPTPQYQRSEKNTHENRKPFTKRASDISIYNKNGKRIRWSEVAEADDVYDQDGNIIARDLSEDSKPDSWKQDIKMYDTKESSPSKKIEHDKVYDDKINSQPTPRFNESEKTINFHENNKAKSTSDISLYSKNGKRIRYSEVPDGDDDNFYDKFGNIIARDLDKDGKPIPWKETKKICDEKGGQFKLPLKKSQNDNDYDQNNKLLSQTLSDGRKTILIDQNKKLLQGKDNVIPQKFNAAGKLYEADSKPIRKPELELLAESDYEKASEKQVKLISQRSETDSEISRQDENVKNIDKFQINEADALYDKHGNTIPQKFSRDDVSISIQSSTTEKMNEKCKKKEQAGELDQIEVDDKNGNAVASKSKKKKGITFYDKDGNPVQGFQLDYIDNVYNKQGNLISRKFDANGTPVPWSQIDYVDELLFEKDGELVLHVYDKDSNSISESRVEENDMVYSKNNKAFIEENVHEKEKVVTDISKIDVDTNLYDINGKRIHMSQIELTDQVYDKYGHLIPRIYNKDGKPIPWSLIDNTDKIYTSNGIQVPRVYTMDGELIPLSQEAEYLKVYNENGDIIQRIYDKDGKLIPFSRLQDFSKFHDENKNRSLPALRDNQKENFYDKDSKPIPWSQVNEYDQVYTKDRQLVPRVYDSHLKPIQWSQMDDILLVYDKKGNLIQRTYDKNGKQISWSQMKVHEYEETSSKSDVFFKELEKQGEKSFANKNTVSSFIETKQSSIQEQPKDSQVYHKTNEWNLVTNKQLSTVFAGPKTFSELTTTTTTTTPSNPKQDPGKEIKQDEYIVVSDVPEIKVKHLKASKTPSPRKSLKNKRNAATGKSLSRQDKIGSTKDSVKLNPSIDYLDTALADFAEFGIERIHCVPSATFEFDKKIILDDYNEVYDKNGNPILRTQVDDYEDIYDKQGNQIPRVYYKSGQPIPWSKVNDTDAVYSKNGEQISRNDGILFKDIVYDKNGMPIPRSQMDKYDRIYDKNGNPIPRVYFKDGQPIAWSEMADLDNIYDENGEIILRAYDQDGKPISLVFNKSGKEYKDRQFYDKDGNPICLSQFLDLSEVYDKDGKHIPWSEVDKFEKVYDKSGKVVPRLYDEHQRLVPMSRTPSIIRKLKHYDKYGRLVSQIFDNGEKPKIHSNRIAYDKNGKQIPPSQIDKFNEIFDKDGNLISRVYDKDGNVIPWSRIDAALKVYDKNGNPISRVYDKDGNPISCSKLDDTNDIYDKSGNLIPLFYDRHGNPIPRSKIDETDKVYGKNGNITLRIYDKAGNPIQWSKMDESDKAYDKNGTLIPRVYDKDGNQIPWSKLKEVSKVYDKNGNPFSLVYDKQGNLLPLSKIDDTNDVYDKNGFLIPRVYDEDGNPLPWSKIDESDKIYDKNGTLVPRIYDKDGNPIHWLKVNDASKVYDKNGNLVPRIYDKDGNPIPWSNIDEADKAYDKNGTLIPPVYDKDGNPISWSKINYAPQLYDKNGNSTSCVYDIDGNLIPWSKIDDTNNVYDKNGNLIPRVYDKDGNPIPWSKIDEVDKAYDKNGTLIPRVYDEDGNQIPWSKLKDASKLYDKNGNPSSLVYDKQGNILPWSKIDDANEVYDKNGNLIPRVYDNDGNPLPWSKIDKSDKKYDKNGTLIPRMYDKDGNPIHWLKVNDASKVYDKNGNLVPRIYDKDGNPIPWSNIDEADKTYDKNGTLISRVYDKDGNPVPWSKMDDAPKVYDKFGNQLPRVSDKNGNSTPLSRIDESNESNQSVEKKWPLESSNVDISKAISNKMYFDQNGNPIRMSQVDDYPEIYDKHGNVIRRYYDSSGKPIPWSKLKGQDKCYDKNGKLIPQTRIFQRGDKDYVENKRKSQINKLGSNQSWHVSSSTFGDLASRSYSGQKQSFNGAPDLKILDWALRKELEQGMQTLQDEFRNNMQLSFERPTKDAQQSVNRLTKMRDQLTLALAVQDKMPGLDSKIAQFSQRITAIELGIVLEMTRYQEEITQQQLQLEMAIEAMVEAIANVAGDPQGIEELNTKLIITKNDIDTLSLAQRDLQDMLNNLKLDLRELRSQVYMLTSTKADRKEVSQALKGKATIADLNQVVSKEEFAGVMEEMIKLITIAYDKFNNQENSWQMAIDEFVKCLNKKAGIKSVMGLSEDIMSNIEMLREKKKYLLNIVGEPDLTCIQRQLDRDDTCLCCDTAVIVPEVSEPNKFAADKGKPEKSQEIEASKRKFKRKVSEDRILCYPGLPPNHDLDPRSVFCNRYCGPAQSTAVPLRSTVPVSIPKELIVKPLSYTGITKELKPGGVDRKPCFPCNQPSTALQSTSNNKSDTAATQSVTVITLDILKK